MKNLKTITNKFTVLFVAFAIALSLVACNMPAQQEISDNYFEVVFRLDEDVTVNIKSGEKIPESKIPDASKSGYEFLGWKDGSSYFDFSKPVTANLTLSPDYRKISVYLDEFGGAEISVLPTAMKDYLALTDESDVAEYLFQYEAHYRPADSAGPVSLTWSADNLTSGENFTVYLSTDEFFAKDVQTYTVSVNRADVYNLIPDTYYWKVVAESGAESETDSFVISENVRAINCGNVVNMRDEGGYVGEFGKVKYGMAYRSADISVANEEAKSVIVDELNIKTEIDLRLDTTTETIDSSITKHNCGYWHNDYIFPNFNPGRKFSQTYADNLKKAFTLFTDESNYPIDFHCSAGADRTGTFAFLLGGILGLSYEDIVHDFEMTSFYKNRRWRSSITINADETYSFDESGVMQDNSGNLVAFDKMYKHMMEAYGTGDGKLSSAVENYMLIVLNLTDYDIEQIRVNMIEGYSSTLVGSEILSGVAYVASASQADVEIDLSDYSVSEISSVSIGAVNVDSFNFENGKLTFSTNYFKNISNFDNCLIKVLAGDYMFIKKTAFVTHVIYNATDFDDFIKILIGYGNGKENLQSSSMRVVLANDIDYNGGNLITNTNRTKFDTNWCGVFDGCGHTISNLTVDRGGVFGYIRGGAVKNLGLVNITSNKAASETGGLLCMMLTGGGTIDNCFVEGAFANASTTTGGGIVELAYNNNTISNCIAVVSGAKYAISGQESSSNLTPTRSYAISADAVYAFKTDNSATYLYDSVSAFTENKTALPGTGWKEQWGIADGQIVFGNYKTTNS